MRRGVRAPGNDLRKMGIPQGPIYKVLLAKVREAQLDGTITTTDEARDMARRLLAQGVSEEE